MEKQTVLIENNYSEFQLVMDEKVTEALTYAATELQDYFFAMTCYQMPIMESEEPQKSLVLTHGSLCSHYGIDRDSLKIGKDGYYIEVAEEHILITGDERGLIYGAYELLEKLGCRFFTDACEKVPYSEKIVIPRMRESYTPPLEYREHLHQSCVDSVPYALKSRLNGGNTKIPKGLGGKYSYAWFCHTFDLICPPDVYYDAHPEYFSMAKAYNINDPQIMERFISDLGSIDEKAAEFVRLKWHSKKDTYVAQKDILRFTDTIPDYFPEPQFYRLRDDTQLCLSNDEVLEIAIKQVRQRLREEPDAKIISVSQNDCGNPCQCPKCKAIDEAEGSYAGSIIHFVNKVAEAIEEEFPHVLVDTFAYLYSRNAPKHIKARHNVCVRLCSIECCFTHPFGQCDYNEDIVMPLGGNTNFVSDVKAWSDKCQHLFIWDYTTNYSHYCVPLPNWKTLKPNAQFLVNHGVTGILEQGNYSKDQGTDLNELRAYIIGKVLWNPHTDVEAHMNEFIDYYYGHGAPYIKEYIRMMLHSVEENNVHCGFAFDPKKDYLEPHMLSEYKKLIHSALVAVKDSPIHSMRIHRAQLSIRYVELKLKSMNGEINKEEINTFFEDCKAHGIVRVEEWVNLPKSRRAFFDGLWNGFNYLGDFRSQNDPTY